MECHIRSAAVDAANAPALLDDLSLVRVQEALELIESIGDRTLPENE
jgi:hypothetical protein